MKTLGQILVLLFIIGLMAIAGRFVLTVIGIGVETVWRLWPLILIGGVVWYIANKHRRR